MTHWPYSIMRDSKWCTAISHEGRLWYPLWVSECLGCCQNPRALLSTSKVLGRALKLLPQYSVGLVLNSTSDAELVAKFLALMEHMGASHVHIKSQGATQEALYACMQAACQLLGPEQLTTSLGPAVCTHLHLTCIQQATLAGTAAQPLDLAELIPPRLLAVCPNLSVLSIQWAVIQPTMQPLSHPVNGQQITALQLKHVQLGAEADVSTLTRQLNSLTNLSHLHIQGSNMAWLLTCLADLLSSNSHQLVTLAVADIPSLNAGAVLAKRPYPALHHLELDVPIGDDDMAQLLVAAPALTSLKVAGFEVSSDFSSMPCTWSRLEVDQLFVDVLPKLPLSKVKYLGCSRLVMSRPCVQPSLQLMTQVVKTVEACGGLRGNDIAATLCLPNQESLEWLPAAVPLLHYVQRSLNLVIPNIGALIQPSTWAQLPVMLSLVGAKLECQSLLMDVFSWEADDAFANIPQLFPGVQQFRLTTLLSANPAEPVLLEFCKRATRHCVLQLRKKPRLKARLLQAMRQAGHQHVVLELY